MKKEYQKAEVKVYEMEIESAILNPSVGFDNGNPVGQGTEEE